MLPVDKYVGGPEHACMHLLYARFITKALRDMGYLHFDEPFKSLVHQGIILGPDGQRMSKSKGNIINPDKYVNEYGSDIFRMYLMFGFSYIEGGPWSDDGIKSVAKFLDRVERMIVKKHEPTSYDVSADKELLYALNYCIKNVSTDMEVFSFNTSIARIMELVNTMYKVDGKASESVMEETCDKLILLLAPIVPHIAEELFTSRGNEGSVFNTAFPVCDESKLVRDEIELAVQVNSRIRAKIVVPSSADNSTIEQIALADSAVIDALEGKTPKKVIVIKNRLVNIVV
jgi:leucyl-tRNA synthetase